MQALYSIFIFCLGTIFGSFYLVVADRLPKEQSIIKPGSHCPYCNHILHWYELIPIFSYLLQRGTCKNCHKHLSWLYPIVELSTGLCFLFSYLNFGFSYEFYVSLLLSSLLIIIFLTDFRYMIILDSPLLFVSIALFGLQWGFLGFSEALYHLASGIGAFLVMFLIGKLGDKMFKRESLGGGDIKLAFVMGLSVGFPLFGISLILSTFLALPYAITALLLQADSEVPFGPFLISALYIVFLYADKFQTIFFLFS